MIIKVKSSERLKKSSFSYKIGEFSSNSSNFVMML